MENKDYWKSPKFHQLSTLCQVRGCSHTMSAQNEGSPVFLRCYYLHKLRDSVSPVCNFFCCCCNLEQELQWRLECLITVKSLDPIYSSPSITMFSGLCFRQTHTGRHRHSLHQKERKISQNSNSDKITYFMKYTLTVMFLI